MEAFIERVALWMERLGAVLTIALILVIGYDVAGRLLFNRPFAGTPGLAATGLVLITFLQLPLVILHKKLLRVTYFYDLAGKLGRSALNALAYAVGAAFFLALVATSWEPLVGALRTGEFYGMDSFRIPAWPLRVLSLILWLIAALVCLFFLVQALRGRMTEAEHQIPD